MSTIHKKDKNFKAMDSSILPAGLKAFLTSQAHLGNKLKDIDQERLIQFYSGKKEAFLAAKNKINEVLKNIRLGKSGKKESKEEEKQMVTKSKAETFEEKCQELIYQEGGEPTLDELDKTDEEYVQRCKKWVLDDLHHDLLEIILKQKEEKLEALTSAMNSRSNISGRGKPKFGALKHAPIDYKARSDTLHSMWISAEEERDKLREMLEAEQLAHTKATQEFKSYKKKGEKHIRDAAEKQEQLLADMFALRQYIRGSTTQYESHIQELKEIIENRDAVLIALAARTIEAANRHNVELAYYEEVYPHEDPDVDQPDDGRGMIREDTLNSHYTQDEPHPEEAGAGSDNDDILSIRVDAEGSAMGYYSAYDPVRLRDAFMPDLIPFDPIIQEEPVVHMRGGSGNNGSFITQFFPLVRTVMPTRNLGQQRAGQPNSGYPHGQDGHGQL